MSDLFDKISDSNELDRMRRERAEEDWRNAVDRIIDEAQQKGAFDNLPGQGKPLKQHKNPLTGERSLAHELLQNNDYTLPWIANRNELLEKIEALRADLQEEWAYYQMGLQTAVGPARDELHEAWRAYVRQFEARLIRLNRKITSVNLTIPAGKLEVMKLSLDRELQRVGASR
ncbi:MAG TPA: DnaJ family domain-containing protein [Candidatus Sulfomarinibacteraceae bacterium]|nr:DnaJ family domain-containing protein [Candidatus Sulfomarinibacteraceae bacterium]